MYFCQNETIICGDKISTVVEIYEKWTKCYQKEYVSGINSYIFS